MNKPYLYKGEIRRVSKVVLGKELKAANVQSESRSKIKQKKFMLDNGEIVFGRDLSEVVLQSIK